VVRNGTKPENQHADKDNHLKDDCNPGFYTYVELPAELPGMIKYLHITCARML